MDDAWIVLVHTGGGTWTWASPPLTHSDAWDERCRLTALDSSRAYRLSRIRARPHITAAPDAL